MKLFISDEHGQKRASFWFRPRKIGKRPLAPPSGSLQSHKSSLRTKTARFWNLKIEKKSQNLKIFLKNFKKSAKNFLKFMEKFLKFKKINNCKYLLYLKKCLYIARPMPVTVTENARDRDAPKWPATIIKKFKITKSVCLNVFFYTYPKKYIK